MYLFIDTETGGVTTEHSLLAVTAIITDANFKIIKLGTYDLGLTLNIRSSKYVVNAKALAINKIDIVSHDQTAIDVSKAKTKLLSYLEEGLKFTGRRAFVVAGHNVDFDRRFLLSNLLTQEDWDRYMTYPFLDTAIIARLLNALDMHDQGYSLAHLVNKFCPEYKTGIMHSSLGDTMATIELARKFVSLLGK